MVVRHSMDDLAQKRSPIEDSRLPNPSGETVVLVHGLAAHWLAMWPLARHLERRGFRVINWGYPSITRNIDEHARRLSELLAGFEWRDEGPRYHLVTHSMGSIIARTALSELAEQMTASPPIPTSA